MKAMNMSKEQVTPLWKRICRYTALDMVAGKMKASEKRWVQWTTYHNLDLWFTSWEKVLDELDFFEVNARGKKIIPDHLL